MQRKFWLLALVSAVLLNIGSALADDGFYVVAVGGGVGTKISSLPYTITQPGFYYLTKDLATTGNGIVVRTDNVTLDLMGFSLVYSGTTADIDGIYLAEWPGRKNVEIRNGTVRGFSGRGIAEEGLGSNNRFLNLRVEYNTSFGISMGGIQNLFKNCHVSNNGGGISSGGSAMVVGNMVCNNGSVGWSDIQVLGGCIIGNVVNNNQTVGIKLMGSANFLMDQNSAFANKDGVDYSKEDLVGKCAWGANGGYTP